MSKDHDYIKELFDSDGIKAPESLSEENMLAMLNAAGEKPAEDAREKSFEHRQPRKRPSLKKWVAVAAVAVVAVFGISGLADILTPAPDTSAEGSELYTFKSEKEIESLLSSMDDLPQSSFFKIGRAPVTRELVENEDAALGNSEATGDVASSKSVDSGSHSETYIQVDDVDEADIVKTDGKYIYCVTNSREVVILSAEDGKTKRLSRIGSSGVENYINDIYLKGDKLVTVGTIYRDDSDESSSGIVVYDISDRSKPEVLFDFSQTGSILSSRMVGDYVYLVTNDYVMRGGRAVPMCGSIKSPESIKVSDICCVPDPRTPSYIVLSAVDISSGEKGRSATKAVFGAGNEIYCNDHNLYCTSGEWSDDSDAYYTRIVRASLDGLKVKAEATARVNGHVDSQFSMDERNGYFRIATTSNRGGIDVNNLYVLDSKLKESGKVTGFARNESIKAVRYIGDKAYVITYEAIDPLFIIDLSDPADPRIEGEVMIDGFSTLLIPVSEGRLLGIGHATGDNGYGGEFESGLKLALFDISDPSEPKVLDSREFENMSSLAQFDHHALMINRDADYFAIPYEVWNYSGAVSDSEVAADGDETFYEPESSYDAGVLLFRAGDKIGAADRHSLGTSAVSRCVYIGDWIYAIDGDGNAQSFRPSI